MFNSVAFDVVIGLVFVYLLYSLLVTIVGEMIMTWLGIRARILRLSIERMLNDGLYEKKDQQNPQEAQNWWSKWLLQEHKDFPNSFAGKFYNYPSIKFLSKVESSGKSLFEQSKPSYISPENFADTVINLLKEIGTGDDPMEKIKSALATPLAPIQPDTAKQINNYLEDSGMDIAVFRTKLITWFNETQDRAKGWFKLKLRLVLFILGFLIAVAFNVDSIQIVKILATDKTARKDMVDMSIAFIKDSAKYTNYLHKGDTMNSAAIIDSSYKRVNKDVNAANKVLGLGWNFNTMLKADSTIICIWPGVNDSNHSKNIDKQVVRNVMYCSQCADTANFKYATQQINNFNTYHIDIQTILERQKPLVKSRDRLKITLDSLTLDSVVNYGYSGNDSVNKAISAALRLCNHAYLDSSNKVAINTQKLTYFNTLLATTSHDLDSSLKINWVVLDSIKLLSNGNSFFASGKRHYTTTENILFILKSMVFSNLIGFLITAIAVSLGAPFWFDLLNKLVSMRGSGANPEEKKPAAAPAK